MTDTPWLTTAELAQLSGVTHRQLQWWHERRLVVPQRFGHERRWRRQDVARVLLIQRIRRFGMAQHNLRVPLDRIAPALENDLWRWVMIFMTMRKGGKPDTAMVMEIRMVEPEGAAEALRLAGAFRGFARMIDLDEIRRDATIFMRPPTTTAAPMIRRYA